MLRRFCIRLLGFFVEIVIILVLFVLPFLSPLGFAALTGALAFVTGLHLELSRVPFDVSYFHRTPTRFSVLVLSVVTVFEVLLRLLPSRQRDRPSRPRLPHLVERGRVQRPQLLKPLSARTVELNRKPTRQK